MKRLIIFICLFLPIHVFSQYTELSYTNQVPTLYTGHGAESSSLTSSITNNADLHSGALNVQIPLYVLVDQDFKIPISLIQNTQGVRINDHPGWVGMNNSLTVSASITVVSRGLPDQLGYSWTQNTSNGAGGPLGPISESLGFNYFFHLLNSPTWASMTTIVNAAAFFLAQQVNGWSWHTFYASFYKDLEPDRYIYNIFGRTGEFYLAPDGRFYDLKGNFAVEPIIDILRTNDFPDLTLGGSVITDVKQTEHLAGFQLTDANGMQYEFNLPQHSYDFFEFSYENKLVSTYHMTEIKNLNSLKSTFFNYTQKDYTVAFNGYRYYRFNETSTGYSGTHPAHRLGGRLFQPWYLTSIESPNYLIDFNLSESTQLPYDYNFIADRYFTQSTNYQFFLAPPGTRSVTSVLEGLWGPNLSVQTLVDSLKWHKLDDIKVYFKNEGNQNLLHTYQFDYNNNPAQRLKLESCGEVGIPKYEFEYDNFEGLLGYYPLGLGHEDHEGFYNGKVYPNYTSNSTNQEFLGFKTFREPDFQFAKRGSLKSITLPTGAGLFSSNFLNMFSTIIRVQVCDDHPPTSLKGRLLCGIKTKSIP